MKKNKKKIMIIDDNTLFLFFTKELLEAEGYEVITYDRGLGATNLIKTIQPDMVLLDINMPGLPGDALASILHSNERVRDIPVVFHSSNNEDSLRKAVAEHKARGYICKGDVSELKRKVAIYLS